MNFEQKIEWAQKLEDAMSEFMQSEWDEGRNPVMSHMCRAGVAAIAPLIRKAALMDAAEACEAMQKSADDTNAVYVAQRLPAICFEPDGHECAAAIRDMIYKEAD